MPFAQVVTSGAKKKRERQREGEKDITGIGFVRTGFY